MDAPIQLSRRRFAALLAALPFVTLMEPAEAQTKTKAKSSKRKWAVGAIAMHYGKVKGKRIYYTLILFYGMDARHVKCYPYLAKIDAARANLDHLKAAEAAIAEQIRNSSVSVEAVASRFNSVIDTLRTSGAVSSVRLNEEQAQRLLGSPSMVQGRLATLSDNANRGLNGMMVIGGGGATVAQVATMSMFEGLVVTVSGATTGGFSAVGLSVTAAAGAAVVVAAGGGVAIGLGFNEVAGAIISAATGGDSNSIGEGLATTGLGRAIGSALNGVDAGTAAAGDGDAPPPATTPATTPSTNTASADNSTPPASGSTSNDDSDDEESTDNSNDGQSTDDQSSDDTDDSCTGTDCVTGDDGAGGAGTSLPPDMDTSGSGLGNIILYGMTGLLGHEARTQLRALDLFAGGLWGVSRRNNELSFALALDQLLGGGYLKSIERGLSSRRDQHGIRDFTEAGGEIDVSRLPNYGLINPSVIDVIFQGRTMKTRNLRLRRIDK